jgi:hypothetical protein
MDSDILSAMHLLIPLLVASDIRFPGKWYAGDYTARSGPQFTRTSARSLDVQAEEESGKFYLNFAFHSVKM